MSAAEARLLRAVSRSLEAFDTDIGTVEKSIGSMSKSFDEHEAADVRRFLQVHHEISKLNHSLEFLHNRMDLVHDQLIEGFRALKVVINKRDPNEITPRRVV